MDVLSLALGVAAGAALGYLPTRLRRRTPAEPAPVGAAPAGPAEAPQSQPVVVVVERAPEPEPVLTAEPEPEPEPPLTTPDALELLKERDRRLTADAKLRLIRD